ncbi:MAG: amidohydrolase family protein [Pseudomonadota bacterium]
MSEYLTHPLRTPSLLANLHSDEYCPPTPDTLHRRMLHTLRSQSAGYARSLGLSLANYLDTPMGTSACLMAINAAAETPFYRLSEGSCSDADAAAEQFHRDELVIDVQTHFVAGHRVGLPGAEGVHQFIRHVAPDLFHDMDTRVDLCFEAYLRCVFLQSETSLAVLTSAPGTIEENILSNPEIAGARMLVERLSGSRRLLHHSIVHPNLPGELDAMAAIVERYRPDGFKVYTLYGSGEGNGWRLDDDRCGLPFLDNAASLGVSIICAHKGLSGLAPTGSPNDVGPAAAAFPNLKFLIYHSGYEVPRRRGDSEVQEGAFPQHTPANELSGTDRLVASLKRAGVTPGSNVYAELGSTWYLLASRPQEAAHVLGKLLLAVGEDNILWGTDSVWYGNTQPLIDAFRTFHIPAEFQEKFGYPELTDAIKAKILGLNAAAVYNVDPQSTLEAARRDELGWLRSAVREFAQWESGGL